MGASYQRHGIPEGTSKAKIVRCVILRNDFSEHARECNALDSSTDDH